MISKETHAENRLKLMRDLPDGLIVAAGSEETTRNHDVSYLFRQNSNFLYLTGVEKAGYALLLDAKAKKETLFIPRLDQKHLVWEGNVPSPADHKTIYGFSQVRYLDELPEVYAKASKKKHQLYTDAEGASLLKKLGIKAKKDQARYLDAIDFCRATKNPGELEYMTMANRISDLGHRAAMRAARPGLYEFQVQAVMEAEWRKAGAKHDAYPAIVATGANGACLHYRDNDAVLQKGDMLLIDAGCEWHGYASDITRTFPVDGLFSPLQRDLYNIVLETQKACIEAHTPGKSVHEIHRLSQVMMAEGLIEAKLLKVDAETAVDSGAMGLFYPHGLGHMLGLDVHDSSGGKRHRAPKPPKGLRSPVLLDPGMVVTVEPGIYFIPALIQDKELRAKFKKEVYFTRVDKLLNFGGIRIEDNIVVTEGGPLNLTTVPKEIWEIEEVSTGGLP